ncbi:site-2 protease family protein [Myxococcus sp. 1LA]
MHYALVLLALGGLLTLHELGHLVAARMLGVRVPRFVFGFGPPLVSFRLWGTQYVVAAVPLGATAHLQGMNPHRADVEEAAGFAARGPLLRILIILAGPLANYALALGVLFALYMSGTHVVVPLTVGTVQPGSEAARAQLLPGDRIVQVAGQPLRSWSEFVEKVGAAPGVPLELGVERGGEKRSVVVRPRPDERGTGRIGVSQQYVYKAHGAGEALSHSFTHTVNVASEGVALLKGMMRGLESPDAASPGALVRQESADAMASGTDALLRTLVAASVVLALLTLLPVPGLDGGRVLLLLVEAASGRRIPPRVETVAQTVGFLGIAVAVLLMATAEIRRALPAKFGLEEATAQDAGTAQPPPAASGVMNGAAPAPAPGASAKGSGSAGPGPAGTDAGSVAVGKPVGAAAPGGSATPAGAATTSPTPGASPAGKASAGTGAATSSNVPPSTGGPTGTGAADGGADAGTPAATAPHAAGANTGAPGVGQTTTAATVGATPTEAKAGSAPAPSGTATNAGSSTSQTPSAAPEAAAGSPTPTSNAAPPPPAANTTPAEAVAPSP